jgi:hypothetical protein
VSEIALWYTDALRQLGTLPGMLKQRLEVEGELIVEILRATILPSRFQIPDFAPLLGLW